MKILVLNLGSSSIKFKLFDAHNGEDYSSLASGLFDRIGKEDSKVTYDNDGNKGELKRYFPTHQAGMSFLEELLIQHCGVIRDRSEIDAVGHRVVHGGDEIWKPSLINDEVIAIIEKYNEFAPLHNPINLLGIQEAKKIFNTPHVGVFDTAFHSTMPDEARVYGLPFEYFLKGIKKYGFHGTSHHYVTLKAAEILGIAPDKVNLITCHLGNGSSIAAVKEGKSVDTSMGFTPLEGLIMGTRCGDIDPAAVFYIMEKEGLNAKQIDGFLNKKCGMYALAGAGSQDMRDIWKAAEGNDEKAKQARLALKAFAHRVGEYVGGYAWHLGGNYHAIVFTAGIGEKDYGIRRMVLQGQEKNGIMLDEEANRANKTFITTTDSPKKVLVIPTNEELMIARYVYGIVKNRAA